MLTNLKKWQETPQGLILFGLAELALAYGFGSLSIDRGNLWWYLLTIVFFIGGLKNLFKLFGTLIHVRNKTS
jgi:hypothetical protein